MRYLSNRSRHADAHGAGNHRQTATMTHWTVARPHVRGELRREQTVATGVPLEVITQGEARVLRYLPTHLSARQIAAELYLSMNTVKTHQRHLYAKLDAHNRAQAVERARALGLLVSP
ncbi:MAG TPA: LuxR C-terminal-related transcriptional regulator [Trebonia sp.]|nr:LuxR C-terminal-related transcriptional regulator [Trebonia sp.]